MEQVDVDSLVTGDDGEGAERRQVEWDSVVDTVAFIAHSSR